MGIRTSSHIANMFHAHNAKDDYRKVVLFPGIQEPPSHYGLLMIIRLMRSFALAGISGKMPLSMLATSIRGVEVDRRWRISPGKRSIVTYISPQASGSGFHLRQH